MLPFFTDITGFSGALISGCSSNTSTTRSVQALAITIEMKIIPKNIKLDKT